MLLASKNSSKISDYKVNLRDILKIKKAVLKRPYTYWLMDVSKNEDKVPLLLCILTGCVQCLPRMAQVQSRQPTFSLQCFCL